MYVLYIKNIDLSIGKMKKFLARVIFPQVFSESSFYFMWRVGARGRGTGHIVEKLQGEVIYLTSPINASEFVKLVVQPLAIIKE